MAKDSYWFKHDSSAGRGLRMRKMAFIYGHWGKGVYWDVIEVLREQQDYSYNSDDTSIQMLADIIGCKDAEKFAKWFADCIAFQLVVVVEGRFFSDVLCENMKVWEKFKLNGSQGGRCNKKVVRKLNESQTKAESKLNENIIDDMKRKEKRREEYYVSFLASLNSLLK